MATVYERVKKVVVDTLEVKAESVQEETSFTENLNADSLDLVALIQALEEEFSTDENPLQISEDDANNIHTVKDAVEYLVKHGVKETADV